MPHHKQEREMSVLGSRKNHAGEHVAGQDQIYHLYYSLIPRAWPTDKEPLALLFLYTKAYIYVSTELYKIESFESWDSGAQMYYFTGEKRDRV